MENAHSPAIRNWLSVDDAFLTCQERGLVRTKKTIRQWCRQEHVDCQKQVTPTGECWMLEQSSLEVKIASELEFQQASSAVLAGANQFEPVQTKDAPVHTDTDAYEQGRTRHVSDAVDQTNTEQGTLIAELESKVQSLEIDKAVRDKHVDFLKEQNAEGQRNLLSQSRYIGHLETQVVSLGGVADQTFLKAPLEEPSQTPETASDSPQRPPFDPVH